jgi:phenylalanyl-tRNA synthetase beta chain
LPLFPGIERDISFIVPENVAWGSIHQLIGNARLDRLDGYEFVTTYRGAYRDSKNAEHNLGRSGKKAVTVRLRFRDPARTLRHEEVDPQVATLVSLASSTFGAELRA